MSPHLSIKMKYKSLNQAIILIIISVCCYGGSLEGEFVFDDTEAIVKNPDVMTTSSFWQIFQNDFWGTAISSNNSHKSYRPLTVLSFRINHYIEMNPYHMKITNLVLHICVCLCVRLIYIEILQNCNKDKSFFDVAFYSSVLFSAHPLHVEAVSSIVGRAEVLSALMYSLAFLSFVKCTRGGPMTMITWTCATIVLGTFALLCKENGITVLAVCSIYDVLTHYRHIKSIISSHSNTKLTQIGRERYCRAVVTSLLIRQTVIVLSGCIILYMRLLIMDFTSPTFQKMDNPMAFNNSVIVRTLTQNYLYALNLWLLICPEWLCCDWSFGCIPLVSDWSDYRILTVVLPWLTLVLLIMKGNRVLLMGVALLVMPFLPASGIIKVGFVIAERVLYIPSIGFCLLVGTGVARLATIANKTTHTLFLFLVIIWCFRTHIRALQWTNSEDLFDSAAAVCPNNAKIQYNRAKITADKGNLIIAESLYREALRLHPNYEQVLNNLGNLLRDIDKVSEAEDMLRKAIAIRPNFAAAWMNLGVIQASTGKKEEAMISYNRALQYRPKYADCYYNLGNLYLDNKDLEKAVSSWKKATDLKPTHLRAWTNLLNLLESYSGVEEVLHYAQIALGVLPNESVLHFTLANCLGKAKKYESAERYFNEAIKLNPKAVYYSNLGVLYHRWGKIEQAQHMYLLALNKDPALKSATENLAKLMNSMSK